MDDPICAAGPTVADTLDDVDGLFLAILVVIALMIAAALALHVRRLYLGQR